MLTRLHRGASAAVLAGLLMIGLVIALHEGTQRNRDGSAAARGLAAAEAPAAEASGPRAEPAPIEAAAAAAGAREAVAADVPAAPAGDGEIVVRALHDWPAGVEPRWTARHADGTQRRATGWSLAGLQPGEWKVEPEGEWRFTAPSAQVEAGARASLWALMPVDARVAVRDEAGGPIEGASLLWTPATDDGCKLGVNPHRALGRTDAEGTWRGRIDDQVLGRLHVLRAGFAPASRRLDWSRERELAVVLRRAEGEERVVRLEDAPTALPAAGVELQHADGTALAASDREGALRVPPEARGAEGLRLAGAGYGVLPIWGELPDVARLWPSAAVEIRSDRAFEAHVVGVGWPEDVEGLLRPSFPPLASVEDAVRVGLPRGLDVDVLALAADGAVARGTLRVAEGAALDLRFEGAAALAIEPVDPGGEPIQAARAEVSYRSSAESPTRGIRCEDGRALRVESPDTVSSVRVTAPGFGVVHLVPDPAFEPHGRLVLEMAPEADVAIRTRDAQGAGVPGVVLRLTARKRVEPMPGRLVDDAPTAHPAWFRRHVVRTAETDQLGRARVSLAAGAYDLRATLPWARNPGSGFYACSRSVEIEGRPGETIELRLPRPLFVRVEARDAATSRPIERFDVEARGGSSRDLPEASTGGTWSGWIADDVEALVLRADGYRAFTLAGDLAAEEPIRCALVPADAVLIRVEGDGLDAWTAELGYRVLHEEGGEGEDWKPPGRTASTGSIAIAGGFGVLALPFEAGRWIELSGVEHEGRTLVPRPARFRWDPARAEVAIRLEPEPEPEH